MTTPPVPLTGTRSHPMPRFAAVLVLATLALAGAPVVAQVPAAVVQSEEHAFRVTRLAGGLEHPWSIAFLPDGRWLVTERPGRLRVVRDGRLDPRPVAGLPAIAAHGQGGLMDVVPHPRFAENRWVYLSYAARDAAGVSTEAARGRLADGPQGARLEDVQVLFRQLPKSSAGQHFGSRIVFDRAGYLYITLGDRGDRDRAQRPDDHAGSVIRLHDDGRVPADNPFAGRPGWKPEKFTLGNRNIQGAALHPQTGLIWAHEHGPQGGDELNVIRAGANYGWPVVTHGVNYVIGTRIGEGTAKPGMTPPIHYWVPTSIAPSGMAFYTGERFPKWRGDLFIGALRETLLVRLKLDGEKVVHEERLLRGAVGRIRDVRQGPDGLIYLLTDSAEGAILRLEPAN